MTVTVTDRKRDELISMDKYCDQWLSEDRLTLGKDGISRRLDLDLGPEGCGRMVTVRQNLLRPLDFSVILKYVEHGSNGIILVKYNGNHGLHVDPVTKEVISGPQIHMISEECQPLNLRPESHAVKTERYVDLISALTAFQEDMHIHVKGPKNTVVLDRYCNERR